MKEETKEQLKGLGLETLETISKEGVESLFKVIEIIVQDTDNKIDDMILPVLPVIKAKLLELVEEINP